MSLFRKVLRCYVLIIQEGVEVGIQEAAEGAERGQEKERRGGREEDGEGSRSGSKLVCGRDENLIAGGVVSVEVWGGWPWLICAFKGAKRS